MTHETAQKICTVRNVIRDIVSISTLIGVLTGVLLIGRWVGGNDQKWVSQDIINQRVLLKQDQHEVLENCLKSELSSFAHSSVCDELGK
jgi:hypothetical protein